MGDIGLSCLNWWMVHSFTPSFNKCLRCTCWVLIAVTGLEYHIEGELLPDGHIAWAVSASPGTLPSTLEAFNTPLLN